MSILAGVSESLLMEMGVRFISVDRPGYRGTALNAKQTFEIATKDMV